MGLNSLGVIPAAGKANRFNGLYKELLPCKEGVSFLSKTYALLREHCDAVVLVTNEEKIAAHARDLGSNVLYLIQWRGRNFIGTDIMGAIYQALTIPAKRYYFAMPDTVVPQTTFYLADPNSDFQLGVFETHITERFGVLEDGFVMDKRPNLPLPAKAWGVLVWSYKVRDLWLEARPENYTEAINMAIKKFGYTTFDLEHYYDIAFFDDYMKYLLKESNE